MKYVNSVFGKKLFEINEEHTRKSIQKTVNYKYFFKSFLFEIGITYMKI